MGLHAHTGIHTQRGMLTHTATLTPDGETEREREREAASVQSEIASTATGNEKGRVFI